jgi:hypothetical protein
MNYFLFYKKLVDIFRKPPRNRSINEMKILHSLSYHKNLTYFKELYGQNQF